MKYIKLTTLIFLILLLGCNQTGNKKTLSTEKLTNKKDNNTLPQEELVEKEELDKYEISSINNVIELFKQQDVEKISNIISFPLRRQYPIPSVKDKKEFIDRFNEIFDKNLINQIANSKINQWNEVGWRGIMLDNGIVWMANSDGIITTVNYQSDVEKKLRNDLIAKEKENLYISLKTFENPIFKINTKTSYIRIDEISEGKYRFASWKIGEMESSKPETIINNGTLEFLGSGGNHVVRFNTEEFTYNIYRNEMAEEDAPDITFEIEKNEEIILTEDGTLKN